MILTDKEALRQLKIVNSAELRIMIDDYPQDEVEGESDLELLYGELSYLLEKYRDSYTMQNDNLREAREVIRKTRKGVPMMYHRNKETFVPMYTSDQIQYAKDVVNEYRRLESLEKRLKGMI